MTRLNVNSFVTSPTRPRRFQVARRNCVAHLLGGGGGGGGVQRRRCSAAGPAPRQYDALTTLVLAELLVDCSSFA